MKILETITLDTNSIEIGQCMARPIEDMKNNGELKSLADSMEESGQLHSCSVRIVNNKYELIAGGRRFVAAKQKGIPLEVKVVDATDIEAMELGIVENLHRKDFDIKQRDMQIYKVWKFGKKNKCYKEPKDLAKRVSLSVNLIKNIIYAGELTEKKEYKDSEIIKKSSTSELVATKALSDLPEIRKKILEQKEDMNTKDIGDISKKIRNTIKSGVDKKIVEKAVDIMSPKKEKRVVIDNSKVDSSIDSTNVVAIKPKVIFQPNELAEMLDVVTTSPVDVQKVLVKGEITVEDAKIIAQYKSQEKREATIKEMKTVERSKQLSAKVHDGDKNLILETRNRQEEDINKRGFTRLRTAYDLQLEQKLKNEESYETRYDASFIERYQKLKLETINVLGTFHPRKMKKDENRKDAIKAIKNIYRLYQILLEEIGEIAKVESVGSVTKAEDVEILRIA